MKAPDGRRVIVIFVAVAIGAMLALYGPAAAVVGQSSQPGCPGGAGLAVGAKSPPGTCPRLKTTPSTGLRDLEQVTVTGHFGAQMSVGVAQCDARTTGPSGCDLSSVVYVFTDSLGRFSTTFHVRRLLSTPDFGAVDCASQPGACLVGAADISNFSFAATDPLTFDPRFPPIPTTLTANPSTNLADRQPVEVKGTGDVPGSTAYLAECASLGQCDYGTNRVVTVGPNGSFKTTILVHRIIANFGPEIDCAAAPGTCELFEFGRTGPGSFLHVPLDFNPSIPPVVPTVAATPSTGLIDHQLISVHGGLFSPGARISVVQCELPKSGGVQCGYEFQFATADGNGAFTITYPVHRMIEVNGTVDCAKKHCALMAINEFRGIAEEAAAPLQFDPSVPPVVATLNVNPSTGLIDNQRVGVTGAGFTPFATVLVAECTRGQLTSQLGSCLYQTPAEALVTADGSGAFTTSLAVHTAVATQSGVADCSLVAGKCVVAGFDNPRDQTPAAVAPLTFVHAIAALRRI